LQREYRLQHEPLLHLNVLVVEIFVEKDEVHNQFDAFLDLNSKLKRQELMTYIIDSTNFQKFNYHVQNTIYH